MCFKQQHFVVKLFVKELMFVNSVSEFNELGCTNKESGCIEQSNTAIPLIRQQELLPGALATPT